MRRAVALVLLSLLTATCGAGADPAAGAGPAGPAPTAAEPAPATIGLGERRSEGGAVEVVATWVATDPPAMKVTMDTHTVDLDGSDLATLARVRLDGGTWVAPTAVDVPNGGHHREGTLTFATLRSGFDVARVVELEIRDIAVPVRLLRWERRS